MRARLIVGLIQIARVGRSALLSLVVFIPVWESSEDFVTALRYALPMWLTCMMIYATNDLNDLEKDRENHPERALPSGTLTPALGALFFFAVLGATLLWIRLFIPDRSAFVYLCGIIIGINYSYVVSFLWPLKNVYVALKAVLPLFLLWQITSPAHPLLNVALAVALYVVGAEILSDVNDLQGDGITPAKWMGPRTASGVGFTFQLAGGLVLLVSTRDWVGVSLAAAIMATAILLAILWHCNWRRRSLVRWSAIEVAIGSYFLF
jgi:4-hydroxybenzoate polyprenyltransferase